MIESPAKGWCVSADRLEQITVLVHGTFANPDYAQPEGGPVTDAEHPTWWRLTGQGDDGTTADRLQKALEDLDSPLAATMWRPGDDPRDGDMSYRDLGEWSGANTHKARVGAAETLAASLQKLADRRGCQADNPLLVNFVAHSHGGNVVLDSLKRLADNVKPRQVCMLGTPLTWRFTDPRIFYLGYLFFFLAISLVAAGQGLVEGLGEGEDSFSGAGLVVAAIILYLLLLPLILWMGVIAITFARVVSGLFPGKPAYGSRPKLLEKELGGRPAVLFISPEDEADLMLQLGAAPLDAYRALVRGRPSLEGALTLRGKMIRRLLRYVELAYVRPFSYVIAIPLVEIVLERVGLGFPLRSVLFRNYEMVTWTRARTYQETQIVTSPVASDILQPRVISVELTERRIPGAVKTTRRPGTEDDTERIQALRHTLLETMAGLRKQVHLRHSGYYESQEVIDAVAKAIAAPDAALSTVEEPTASH